MVNASNFTLAYSSYEKFKNVVKRSKGYYVKEEKDNVSGDDIWNIYRYGCETPVQTYKNMEDRCPGCTTCVAHLMMCEYSIVLGKCFNLKYFDVRHHYRSKVETSLRQRDLTSDDEHVERAVLNIDGGDDNDNDAPTTATADLSTSDSVMTLNHFSEIGGLGEGNKAHNHRGAMLSPTELMTIFGEIVGNKSKCSNDVKRFVDGMAISLHHLVRDGKSSIPDRLEGADINTCMEDIVQRYKSSFSTGLIGNSRNKADANNRIVVNQPHSSLIQHASKVRLKPLKENEQIKRRKTLNTVGQSIHIRPADVAKSKSKVQRKARKCSYCGHSNEPRHRIESCPIRIKHVGECNNHVIHTELECHQFITRMRETMPIYDPLPGISLVTNAIVKNGNQNTTNARHVKVLGCYAKHLSTNYGTLEPRQMIFKISVIGPTGIVNQDDKGIFIEGSELYNFVTNLNITRSAKTISLRNARYIYDLTYNNTDGKCKERIKK